MAPTFTNAQVIAQIDSGVYWRTGPFSGDPIATSISYGIPTSSSWVASGYGEQGGWSALNATQASSANLAFELWDDLIAVDLDPDSSPNSADIRVSNTTTDIGYAHAYFPGTVDDDSYSWEAMSGSVWLNPSYSSLSDPDVGEYGHLAILHEIGHAMGLNHPGSYNGGSPTYEQDAEYAQDTRMYTVMSYFDAENTGADWYAPNNYWYYAQTPMLHDVMTIQSMYGADYSTRDGDTVYGFNSNADKWIYDFSQNYAPVLTIWDGAGNDTLDLSGWSHSSTISLVPGTFTHGNAMTYNIAIAFDAWIENAVGGSGDDSLVGNDIANKLEGGAGSDSLNGALGNDWLDGGLGYDLLLGGAGDDMLVYDASDNLASLNGGTGFDTLVFYDTLIGFDLVGHGLEQSLVIVEDDGSQSWDQIFDYYDIYDRKVQQDTYYDNLSYDIRIWDVDDLENWSEHVSSYDASGNLISETFIPDGGVTNQSPTDIGLSNNSVDENVSNGTVVGLLTASDPDSGETFAYSLTNSAGGRFAIQGNQLVVADGSLLDYEDQQSHNVTVRVTDSANNTYDESFVIGVDDVDDTNQSPTDIGLSNNSVDENVSDGTVVGSLTASDPDSGETFTYSLTNSAGGRFAIQGNQLVVADGSLLDYEGQQSHNVTVRVTDSANNTYDESFVISVDDVDDTGGGSGGGATHTGTEGVDNLVGTAGDDTMLGLGGDDTLRGEAGDDILEGGAGGDKMFGGSGNDTFVFGNGSGRDILQDFVDGSDTIAFSGIDAVDEFSDLTISKNNSARVVVRYTDDEGTDNRVIVKADSAVNLDESDFDFSFDGTGTGGGGVTNQSPTDIGLSNNSVDENVSDGTVVGSLTASDPDSGETFTYSLTNSAGGRFAIQGNQLVVADGSLLDYEGQQSHNVTVRVTDSANNTYDESFVIGVDDVDDTNQSPTDIGLSNNSVDENVSDGTVVGSLTASDPDSGETFTYSLTNSAGGRFAIQGNQLVVADGSLLDYEGQQSHNVTVRVMDSANNTYDESFVIGVDDVDDTGGGSGGGATHTGTEGVDNLVGTAGDDTMLGLGGDDTLRGEAGDDILEGGAGGDKMFGGSGNDTFVFGNGSGRDILQDFVDGSDTIAFSGIDAVDEFSDLTISRNNSARVVVRYTDDEGTDNRVIVKADSAVNLDESDFEFNAQQSSSDAINNEALIDSELISALGRDSNHACGTGLSDYHVRYGAHDHADEGGFPAPTREYVDLGSLADEESNAMSGGSLFDDTDLIDLIV